MTTDEWKVEAQKNQQNFANSLGDRTWDKYAIPTEDEYLWKAIAFAIAGPPQTEDSSENYGYTKNEQEKIIELKQKCIDQCKGQGWADVYVAFIFVCAYKNEQEQAIVPLIRIKYSDGKNLKNSHYLDHCGRVYNNWSDFLDENIFDGWWICVPKNAEYLFSDDNQVRIDFYDQTSRGEVLRVTDKISTVANIGTSISMAAGLVMSFFPPTAAIGIPLVAYSAAAGLPGAVYGTSRSIGTLVDRGKHDQSINPFSSGEARSAWLTTTASALSIGVMASTQILASTAKAGYLASAGTRAFCTALNVTALSVNGLGIVNSFYEISKKDKVTGLDILQLTTSIFFFTHSAVTFKTASAIIKEAQGQALAAHRENLTPEQQKVFDQMLQSRKEMAEPGKAREMHGNKEFIRDLKIIENKQEFFQAFQLVDGNKLSVNNELILDGKAFLQMTLDERTAILKHSNDLQNNIITEAQFYKNVAAIRKEYRFSFERQRATAVNKLQEGFNVADLSSFDVNGKKIFENIKPHEIDRMNHVMTQAGKNYDQNVCKWRRKWPDKRE